MNLSKKMKKGFTLVELIVVIAIIAILAAVSVAGYFGFINQAKVSTANQEATQVKTILVAQTVADGYSVKLDYDTGTNTTAGWVVTYTQNSGLVVSQGKGTSEVTSELLSAPVASKILAEIYTAGNSEKTISNVNDLDLGFAEITSPKTKAAVVATVTSTTIESFQYYTKDAIKANPLYLK